MIRQLPYPYRTPPCILNISPNKLSSIPPLHPTFTHFITSMRPPNLRDRFVSLSLLTHRIFGGLLFFSFYPLLPFIKGCLAVIEGHDQRLLYLSVDKYLYYNSPFLSHFFSLVSYTIPACDLFFFCPYSAQQSQCTLN